MRVAFIIACISTLFSCSHPESQTYERNQGESNLRKATSSSDATNPGIDVEIIDNVLKWEKLHGVRYVWIEVNGMRLRFIFDTGASNICISTAEAAVLYRQGTLKKEDVLDIEYFQDATGRISAGTKINLRTVKIGNKVLTNIEATVIDNANAPLLLGQSVLEKFGRIEIDNNAGEIRFR